MNKTTIKKTLLLFGVCAAPLLFQACESSFLKSAMEALNPIPDVFVGMDWGDENSVYINPGSKSIDGTLGVVSGVFLNGGKSIWPNYDLAASGPNSSKKAWSIVSSDETNFPAGSLVTMLTNNSSPSSAIAGGIPGELITLSFGTEALCMENFVNTLTLLGSETGQVTYSFILTPAAFHGADSASMSTNTLTRNFNLILPTYTGYGKQWLERYMYGTISASWTEG
ncbi:MAG: hypothetical protein LBD86_05335, partial [Spirochaetaceae bacterium]|nr:hypothetical protein [Spirochaetaceae bacterium]